MKFLLRMLLALAGLFFVLGAQAAMAAPSMTLSTSAGPTAGGTTVTVTASGFDVPLAPGMVVIQVDSGNVTPVTFVNGSQVRFTTPAHAAGAVTVRLYNLDSTAAVDWADATFTYAAVPSVSAITPPEGPTSGGTSVTILGTGFTDATAVKFGGVNAASYTIIGANRITAVSPSGSAGTVDIRVTTAGGTSATGGADRYTYVAAPTVTAVSPSSGPVAGGTTVIITGTGFTDATDIQFGGVSASYTVDSSTQITATAPAGSAGTVDVTVTSIGGTSATSSSDQFTYVASPVVHYLSSFRMSTNGGSSISIQGTNLWGATAVTFGNVPATMFTVNSATMISAEAPPNSAGVVDLSVTTPGGTYTLSNVITYVAPPAISAWFSPSPVAMGSSTGLNISIANSNATALTDVGFSSTYPAGLSGLNAQATVCGGTVTTSVNGLTLTGATIAAGGTCNFPITLQATASGTRVYSTGPVGSGSPGQYGNTATATLVVTQMQLSPAAGALPLATAGMPYSQAFTGSGGTPAYIYLMSGPLPAGMSFVDGIIQGTPTQAGTFNFVIYAQDSLSQSASETYSLTVAAPTITLSPATLAGGAVGSAYNQVITASGGAGPYVFTSSGILPPGLSLSSGGVLDGVPAAPGTYTFTVSATDSTFGQGAPFSGSQSYTMSIGQGGQTVSFISTAPSQATAGGATYTPVATATSGLAVTFTTFPTSVCTISGGVVSFLGAGTCVIDAHQAGNGAYLPAPPVQQTFVVSLTAPPQAPVIVTPANGAATNAQSITVAGTADAGSTVTIYLDGQLAGTVTASGMGNWTYAMAGVVDGTHVLTATATDAFAQTSGQASSVSFTRDTVTLQIAVTSPASGTMHAPGTVTFTGTAEPGSTVTLFESGVLGTVTADGSGNWSLAVANLGLGAHTITAAASDVLGNPATVAGGITLTVVAAPVVADVSGIAVPFMSSGTAIDLSGAITGSHTAIAIGTAPSHGTISIAGDVVTYTPVSGYFGADSFAVTAAGVGGTSAPATISLVVGLPPAPVVAAPSPVAVAGATAAAPTQVAIDVSNAIFGNYSGIAIAAQPTHGTASITGTVITYIPVVGYDGSDSLTFTAIGPGGTSSPAAVAITVQGGGPVAGNLTLSAVDGQTVDINLLAGASGGPFTAATIAAVGQGGNVSIEQGGAAGNRTFTAHVSIADHFSGTLVVHYTLTNAFGTSAQATITINVTARANPANDQSVRSLLQMQAESTLRFAQAQGQNFARRMERLHGSASPSGMNMALQLTFPHLRDPGLSPVQRERAADLAVVSHFAANGAGLGDAGPRTSAAASDTRQTDERPAGGIGVWTGGSIEFGTQDQDTGHEKVRLTSSGISIGADARIAEGLTLGFGGGFGWDRREADGGPDMRGTNSVAVAYGSYMPGAGLFIDALIGTGEVEFHTRRPVEGIAGEATAQRDGSTFMGSIAFGIDTDTGSNVGWSLYGRTEWLNATLNAYSESGAGILSLRFDRRRIEALGGVLGGRVDTMIDFGHAIAKPRLKVEWRHEFQDLSPEAVDYVDVAGPATFHIGGTGWASDQVEASIGSSFLAPDHWALDLELGLRANSQQRSGGIRVELAKQF